MKVLITGGAGYLGLHPFWVNRYGEFHGEVADKIYSRGFFLLNYPELEIDDIYYITGVCKHE